MTCTGVLLYPLFSEYELAVALSVLKQGGQPIQTIGVWGGPIKGESDLTCLPDTTIADADPSRYDSLLFPGCMDITTLYNNEEIIDFIRSCARIHPQLKIGAISSSPYLLAKAGLLRNKAYTVGMNVEQRVQTGVFDEERYSNSLVVQDGSILTARGRGFVQFGVQFGRMLNLEFSPSWYEG
ncbi:DJ-1/PfpI family protein [Paenibacillus aurantiacus]|uniref:DJ-1/PfpI family protein n=1 Tax=Paenibacillus aurantiacus TaxID=1936118 RepID=A0ABV5KM81_9BACL